MQNKKKENKVKMAQNSSPTRGQTRRHSNSADRSNAKKSKHDEAITIAESNNEGNSPNLYTNDDDGPFRVHMEYIECEGTKNLEIKNLTVGQILHTKLKFPGIVDIKKFGKKTVTIYFNDYQLANELTTNTELSKHKMRAYIPNSYLLVTGVSRGVDEVVDLEELTKELARNYPVVKIERMTKLDRTTNNRLNTNSIRITFRTSKLPNEVTAYKTKMKISPFVGRVKQCNKCYRYGHYSDQCKARESRCVRCGETEHTGTQCCTVKCMHCGGEHEATFHGCEEKTRQKNIKFLMAKNNIGYFEALDLHPTYTKNSFDLLQSAEEFPTLQRKSYASTVKITPRSRVVYKERQKQVTSGNRGPAPPKTQLLVAEPQKNPLGGPSLNFTNPHKTTELEKIQDEFEIFQQKHNQSMRMENTSNSNVFHPVNTNNTTNCTQIRQDSDDWNLMDTSTTSTHSSY